MFTGIIEEIGIIKSLKKDRGNIIFEIESKISAQLKPDQSVSHNGVCLTITKKTKKSHFVTAVKETLERSNLRSFKIGDSINLERSLVFGARLDGHLVQGHVDNTSRVISIIDNKGSKVLTIALSKKDNPLVVTKGSICLNGISLTISRLKKNSFSVTIIPYTIEHTNLHTIKKGDRLNVEFDILGKYVSRQVNSQQL